jgi:DMSO reductase anchor subunit
MLVLTQLSVGAFCVNQMLPLWLSASTLAVLRPFHSLLALALGLLAIAASLAHLGRPQYAWRAFIGLKTSWLSREILAFGVFATLAFLYAGALYALEALPLRAQPYVESLGRLSALAGGGAVCCSVMLYHVTRRQWWSGGRTGGNFGLTGAGLGWATTLCGTFIVAAVRGMPLDAELMAFSRVGTQGLLLLTVLKLGSEAAIFLHLRDQQQGDLKRTALLLWGELRLVTAGRFLLGIIGGIVVPQIFLMAHISSHIGLPLVTSCLSLICLCVGEMLERMTFFTALSAPRMPGGLP